MTAEDKKSIQDKLEMFRACNPDAYYAVMITPLDFGYNNFLKPGDYVGDSEIINYIELDGFYYYAFKKN